MRGSKARVLLLPRGDKPEIYREEDAADIVASRSGVVVRVSALNGKPLVRAGQAVLRGETLVSGTLDSITNAPRAVRARAEVVAETLYEISAVSPAQTRKTGSGGRPIVVSRLADVNKRSCLSPAYALCFTGYAD